MPQRNIHASIAASNRLLTNGGLLQLGGTLLFALLALVLLISHGGAG